MPTSLLTTDTAAAPVRLRDRARTALREALPGTRIAEAATAVQAERADRRAGIRAERSRRRAVALQYGAYPAGRSAASVLLPGGPGA